MTPRYSTFVCATCGANRSIWYAKNGKTREQQEAEYEGLRGWKAVKTECVCPDCVKVIASTTLYYECPEHGEKVQACCEGARRKVAA